nr:hypothetical protein [Nanoarchaeum sp.]
MNKKYFILLIICTFFVIEFTSADIISACGTISSSGYYELNQSISGTATCMTIATSNVDLNCNGSTIYYNTAGGATNYGINAIYLLVPLDNITIRNCDIRDTTAAGTPSGGIQFTRVTDSYIFNNTIQTNGTTLNHGVTLTTGCKRNRIENNTINTLGSGVTNIGLYLITEASYNNITGNNINGVGTLTSSAIYLSADANSNIIDNNNLSTISTVAAANADPHTITIVGSNLNNITNNYIYGQGYQRGYNIYINNNAESNNIQNNIIVMNLTAATGYGIYILRGPSNNVINNTITPIGTGTLRGVYAANAQYTTIQNNNITILRPAITTADGVLVTASPGSSVLNNDILINATSTVNAISCTSSANSRIENNNINILGNGTATTFNGVLTTTSYSNLIINNSIHIKGITILNGVLITTSPNNIIENNSININGTGATNVGVYLSAAAPSNIVRNNTIYSSASTPAYGIYLLYDGVDNLIEKNTVTTYGTTNANFGIYLSTGTNENRIINNTVSTLGAGTTNYGIHLLTCNNNYVAANNISTMGTTTNHGIYILTQANNNTIENNIISTYGTTTNYGIYVNSANYNKLIGNNITANGSTRVAGTTTNNHGIAVGASSYFSEVYNNTIYNDGGRYNYGIYSFTNSRWGVYSGNDVHTGGTGALNVGVYISESHYNIFEDNVFSTSGSTTNHAVYLHSSSMGNTIENNNISTLGGTDSHAFGFLYVAAGGYPVNNILKNNRLISISGRDLNFETASTNGTILIDQTLGNYSFTGTAGTLIVRNESAGQIEFGSVLSGASTLFSNRIFIQPNLAGIDESTAALNKSAVITFYNVSTTSTELQIYRNGAVCPETICVNLTSLQAGNVTFNVTHGGNYSILATSALPTIVLNYPENNFNSSSQNITFNFTTLDDSIGDLNCSIYIDNTINQTNTSVSNGTITNFVVENLQERNHNWSIECYDSAGNINTSELRNFSVIISQPSYSFNYPGNNSYINDVSSVLLNYTVFDSDLRNMTVYLYVDDVLANTSENIINGTELIYNWTSLNLSQHNWSIKTSNGFKNSTRDYNYFNVINLTVNCEAGGPYQENALILVKGNVSDGINYLSSGSLNVSVLEGLSLISTKNATINSNGVFETSFSNLSAGSYSLNSTGLYLGFSKSCTDEIIIGNSASITMEKSISFYELNSTSVTYNISLKATNKGGSNATSVVITDSDSSASPYNVGNINYGNSVERSYLKSYIRNSSGYNVSLAIAFVNGTNLYDDSEVSASSSQIMINIPSTVSDTQLNILKNAQFLSDNSTTVTYNLSIEVVNSGGADLTGIIVNDSDINLNTQIDLNRTESYLSSGTKTISKSVDSQNYTFVKTNATLGLTTYYSNELQILIPALESNSSLILHKSASSYSSNDTTVTYNISLSVTNTGGRNATNVFIYDGDYVSNSYNIGTLVATQTETRSYLLTLNKTSVSRNQNLAIATVNATDYLYSNLIEADSELISVLVPALNSGASLVIDKIISMYNLTNETIDYNITLRATNKGGSNATSVVITDSDSGSSPYNIGNIAINSSYAVSYIKTFIRNSTNYNVTFAIAEANGTDSYDSSEVSANSLEIILTIPETTPEQQISLIKNAYYLSENSTTVTYNLSIEVVNSGGVDLNSITLIDSDLSLNELIDLNRTMSYFNSSIVIIDKAASNTNKLFVSTTATVNTITYSSNQILVRIPGYGGPADAIVYAPASVLTSTSFNTNITVENQNPDIGQDFVIDYWITNSNETTNYSSGQQTIYVGASSNTDITATLTSPSSSGSYKFMSLVTWVGGTATSFDSFEVTSSNQTDGDDQTDSSNTGGGGNGGATISNSIINGNAILESEGIIQIVDYPSNIIIISGEDKTEDIIIKNAGNKTLHNVKVIISGLPLEFYSITPNEVDIEPMSTQTYTVVFTPTEEINKYFFKFIISSDEVNKDENAVLQVKTNTIEERKVQISFGGLDNILIYAFLIIILLIIVLSIKIKYHTVVKKIFLIFIPICIVVIVEHLSVDNLLTGVVSKTYFSPYSLIMLPYIASFLILIFVLYILVVRHRLCGPKYPKNTVLGLIKKNVYTDSGHYVGRIIEVIVHKNKVDSLIIKLNKKTKIRGVIIRYKDVISIGEIVIVNYKPVDNLKNM